MLSREHGEWDPAFKAPHGFWPIACAHLPPPPLSCSLPQGIFLVYDISSERSYQHIMKWVSDVDEVGDATSPLEGEGTSEGKAKGGPDGKGRSSRGWRANAARKACPPQPGMKTSG